MLEFGLDSELWRFKLPDRQTTSHPYRCESRTPQRSHCGRHGNCNSLCLYKLLETQHCTASSFPPLPLPPPALLYPTSLSSEFFMFAQILMIHPTPDHDLWNFILLLSVSGSFFPPLFFFIPFPKSTKTKRMSKRTPEGAQIKQNNVDWLKPVSPHALFQQ